MEYSFRKSANHNLTTIRLDEYGMTIQAAGKEQIISYAKVITIMINKGSEDLCKVTIYAEDHDPICLTNWSFSEEGKKENQSGAYALFVRVLHHHLKDKSKAVFKAGRNMERIWIWSALAVIIAFATSVTADYFGFSLLNPYIQTLILSALLLIIILIFSMSRMPKTYNPGNIPLQFLP